VRPEPLPAPRHDSGDGWPAWSGRLAIIVASGPSARTGVDRLRASEETRPAAWLAIKENVNLVPWAEVVYGCDPAWWKHRKGLPEYTGLKIAWAGANLEYPDIRTVEIAKEGGKYTDCISTTPGKVGGGGNSGFQALNLAVLFGAKRIILVGYDMTDAGGVHWYGRNGWYGANNPNQSNFKRWLTAFDAAAPVLASMGVEVINASPNSAMKSFPRRSIDDALKEWA
jgi:hypothetical protein